MDPLLASLREADRLAYLSALTASANKRPSLTALAGYRAQLAAIPLSVSEPAAGEIRLQWWAEVAGGEREVEGQGHPVGAALIQTIEANDLPRAPLAEMAHARSFDLYADPMPDTEAFEAYAGATASVPIQMACRVLDADAANSSATAAGHAGVYLTIIDRLASLARDRAGRRSFLPADLLLRGWASPDDVLSPDFAARKDDAAERIVSEALAFAERHKAQFHEAVRMLPASLAPAFAPAYAREVREAAIRAVGGAIVDTPVAPEPLREQRAVMRTARLFEQGPSLLGRLREAFRRNPG